MAKHTYMIHGKLLDGPNKGQIHKQRHLETFDTPEAAAENAAKHHPVGHVTRHRKEGWRMKVQKTTPHVMKPKKAHAMTEETAKKTKKKSAGRSKFLSALMRQISTDHGSDLIKAFDSKDKDGFKAAFNTLGVKLRRSMSGIKTEAASFIFATGSEEETAAVRSAIVEAGELVAAHLESAGFADVRESSALQTLIENAVLRYLAEAETETEEVPAEPEAPPVDAVEHFTYEDDQRAKLARPAAEGQEEASAPLLLTRGTAFNLKPDGDLFLLTAGTLSVVVNAETADALRMRAVEADAPTA